MTQHLITNKDRNPSHHCYPFISTFDHGAVELPDQVSVVFLLALWNKNPHTLLIKSNPPSKSPHDWSIQSQCIVHIIWPCRQPFPPLSPLLRVMPCLESTLGTPWITWTWLSPLPTASKLLSSPYFLGSDHPISLDLSNGDGWGKKGKAKIKDPTIKGAREWFGKVLEREREKGKNGMKK